MQQPIPQLKAIVLTQNYIGQLHTELLQQRQGCGVPYPSATNVITFNANGVAVSGCSNVPQTFRNSNVIHIREANCVATFSPAGKVSPSQANLQGICITSQRRLVLNHSVVAE